MDLYIFRDSYQPITLAVVSYVVKAIKSNKSAGSDGIIGELIKHAGRPMCGRLLTLFNLVWDNERTHSYWRESL